MLKWSTVSIYLVTAIGVISNLFPVTTLLIFLSLPLAFKLINFVTENHDRPAIVRTCKYLAVRLHFVSGVLLAIGFYIAH